MGLLRMPGGPRNNGSQDQHGSQKSKESVHGGLHGRHKETPPARDFVFIFVIPSRIDGQGPRNCNFRISHLRRTTPLMSNTRLLILCDILTIARSLAVCAARDDSKSPTAVWRPPLLVSWNQLRAICRSQSTPRQTCCSSHARSPCKRRRWRVMFLGSPTQNRSPAPNLCRRCQLPGCPASCRSR